MKKIRNALKAIKAAFHTKILIDNAGDAGVETLGKIIIALVIVAAVIAIVRSAAPQMFANLFDGVSDAISNLWS